MRPIAEYLLELASTGWGPLALVLHSYFESFILPIAHELFLIPVCLARPNLSFLFALISTTASTFGILTGYGIGKWGGRRVLKKIIPAHVLEVAEEKIHKYDVWAIALACFTPIPVKVFALIAGSVHLNFKKLAIVAFLARGARYMIVAALLYFYGDIAKEWILEYLDWIMIALLVLMVLALGGWHWFANSIPHPDKHKEPDPTK